jgi:predicted metal-dependent peptidase
MRTRAVPAGSTPEVELKMEQAYTKLIVNHPFFATILLRLERVVSDGSEFGQEFADMATDGTRLYYNPKGIAPESLDEVTAVLAHEVMHVAGLHPWRMQQRKHEPWNYACDQAINHLVKEAGMVMPADSVPGVPDKSPEELYNERLGKQGKQGQNGQSGQGNGKGQPKLRGAVLAPKNADGSALSEAQREHQMQEMKIAVQQAATAAKRAGKLPAGLNRFAEDLLEPKAPWREILARFLGEQSKNDYAWTRPNRRYVSDGIIFPSLWSPEYGKVAMGCDTSGSIDREQLREVASEVLGAMDLYTERGQDPTLTVAWFDHAVYPQEVSDAADMVPKGGGGTSFRVVMEWVAAQEEKPKALIMVTDGYSNDFGEEPGVPVLWILTRTYREFKPPFGEVTCTLNE